MGLIELLEEKNYKSISTYLRHNPDGRDYLLNLTKHIKSNNELSNNELTYITLNNLQEVPKCVCGLELNYIKPSKGYKSTCGKSGCVSLISNKKRLKTNQERFGGNAPSCSKDVRDKMSNTLKERYGVNNIQNVPGVKSKTIETNLERYGTEWSSQSESVKTLSKNNLIDQYGVDCTQKIEEVKEKTSKTNLEKYGSEEFLKSKDVRDRIKQTFHIKYGGHPVKTDLIKKKIIDTSLKNWGVTNPTKNKEVSNRIGSSLTKKWLKEIKSLDDNFIRKDQDGYYVLFCESEQKEYKINQTTYNRRKRNGEVISTYLNPLYKNYSKGEKGLGEFIRTLYSGEIKLNDRSILNGYELDIVLEDLKICIEYNGIYFHSDNVKPKKYHINKYLKCQEQGYRLIHIWEDEWFNETDKIKYYLRNLLNKNDNRVYARSCEVRLITNKEYKTFCELNHLQGYANAKHRVGLLYNGEIVSIMSFSPPRVKSKEFIEYEMIRYCNKVNCTVLGSASKLFKFFINNVNPESIITYSDLDKFDSNLYGVLGFNFVKITEPGFFYSYRGERVNRFKLRKSNLMKYNIDINLYNKVYTTGNKKWVWVNNQ